MRERLTMLIGKDVISDIRMGTFHAICAMFLREHAATIGLEPNFAICDDDERYVNPDHILDWLLKCASAPARRLLPSH
jgi:superfamily I DNA/RNA helicase